MVYRYSTATNEWLNGCSFWRKGGPRLTTSFVSQTVSPEWSSVHNPQMHLRGKGLLRTLHDIHRFWCLTLTSGYSAEDLTLIGRSLNISLFFWAAILSEIMCRRSVLDRGQAKVWWWCQKGSAQGLWERTVLTEEKEWKSSLKFKYDNEAFGFSNVSLMMVTNGECTGMMIKRSFGVKMLEV